MLLQIDNTRSAQHTDITSSTLYSVFLGNRLPRTTIKHAHPASLSQQLNPRLTPSPHPNYILYCFFYRNGQEDLIKILPFPGYFKISFPPTFLRQGAPHISVDTTSPTVGAFDVNQVIGFLKRLTLTATSIKCERYLTQCPEDGEGITYNELAS